MNRYYSLLMGIFLIAASSCKKSDYQKIFHDPQLYSNTVHELNSVVMGNNFTPVVASRNYAYASIAGYEVIAAGFPEKYNSLKGQLNGLITAAKPSDPAKTDFEYAALLAFCHVGQAVTFPEGSMKYYIDSLQSLAKDHGMPDDVRQNSEAFADSVSGLILKWSKKDNYLNTRSASKYTVNSLPGRWIPTPPMYAAAVEPHWMEIRPMVMKNASQFRVPAPPEFNVTDTGSKYYKEVMFIKKSVENLTEDQKHMADFWDDNPGKMNVSGHVQFITKKFSPPGHWMSVTGIAAKKANADFGTTVCAFAKTSIALFDAFIQCWDAKYFYNTMRPESVVNKFFDSNWKPYLQTPPFPEYTCGHSTISSSAAEALTSVFGDDFAYADTSELEFGIKSRSFKSFRMAAQENNWARFYGGLHFHNSCIVANEFGKKVGDLVAGLKMKK
ncbi:phosphatase PAP2 family protein [Pedobacter sp. HMF7647]|uniref:Phosphatase PAP2 family protein n=1 Tax=Hufsiella arboris TaxID=2695275 RepID=A0A7K1YF07_9SPHI|nr:vanadium-dependent haloperoxidase [Hufsiella arboris]MXV53186.1 phosphatase PAP2 family protein [Hufsiella arboris]